MRKLNLTAKFSFIQMPIFTIILLTATIFVATSMRTYMVDSNLEQMKKTNAHIGSMSEVYISALQQEIRHMSHAFANVFGAPFALDNAAQVASGSEQLPVLKASSMVLNNNEEVVDRISLGSEVVATVFVRKGDDFYRIATSIKKPDGTRPLGTALGMTHPGYADLIAGKEYIGRATLFNKDFYTNYVPIKQNSQVIGILFIGIDISQTIQTLKNEIRQIKVSNNSGYVFILDAQDGPNKGNLIVHPSLEGKNMWNEKDAQGREFIKDIIQQKDDMFYYWWINSVIGETQAQKKIVVFSFFKDWNWEICSCISVNDFLQAANRLRTILIVCSIFILLFWQAILFYINRHFIIRPVTQINTLAEHLANADLTQRLALTRHDEIGQLGGTFNEFLNKIEQMICKIIDSAQSANISADQVVTNSDELAARTSEQATGMTETSSILEELTAKVKTNSQQADEANQSIAKYYNETQNKKGLFEDVSLTMRQIDESSKKINQIINVINDISFQTNLLALNAAVEAARAGEAGRGFAVVASEVRNLAQKTAESSKTIKNIVTQNVESSRKGMELVLQTSTFFNEISTFMQDIVKKFSQISNVSKEQASAIEQINTAVMQLGEIVNQNATIVEEFLKSGKNMKAEITQINELVLGFQVNRGAGASAPASASKATPAVKTKPATAPAKPAPAPAKPASKKDKPPKVEKAAKPKAEVTAKSDAKADSKTPPKEDDFFAADGFEEF